MLFEEIKNTECVFFDSHAHYYDERFFGDENPDGADALLSLLFERGLLGAINVSASYPAALEVIEQAKRYEKLYAAVGVHPEELLADGLSYAEQIEKIRALAENRIENKIVAIGEIGLDYYWRQDNKAEQKDCFERQLALAEELSLPVIIHDREAHGDCFETVLRYPNVKGVFHSYSGSAEMAKDLVRRGYTISFSGTVTFKNARTVTEAAAALPRESVMIETDAPYLTPHPHRGKMNHSGYLSYTAAALAALWQTSVEEVARITEENAKRFFRL
jgi:TatD DNase family protein